MRAIPVFLWLQFHSLQNEFKCLCSQNCYNIKIANLKMNWGFIEERKRLWDRHFDKHQDFLTLKRQNSFGNYPSETWPLIASFLVKLLLIEFSTSYWILFSARCRVFSHFHFMTEKNETKVAAQSDKGIGYSEKSGKGRLQLKKTEKCENFPKSGTLLHNFASPFPLQFC